MLGAFSNGFIQDKFGRRVAYIIGGVTTAIGKHNRLPLFELVYLTLLCMI